MLGFNDLPTAVKMVIALAFVLALVLLAGLLLRKIAGGRLSMNGQAGRARAPRLGIVDMFDLDRQRQLILLRRDNVEHLVMIGGPNDVVIEAGIVRSAARASVGPTVETPDLGAPDLAIAAQVPAAPRPAASVQPPVQAVAKPATAPRDTTVASAVAATGAAAAGAPAVAAEPPLPPVNKPIIEPIVSPPSAQPFKTELDEMSRDLEAAFRRPLSGAKPPSNAPAKAAAEPPVLPRPESQKPEADAKVAPRPATGEPQSVPIQPAPPAPATAPPAATPASAAKPVAAPEIAKGAPSEQKAPAKTPPESNPKASAAPEPAHPEIAASKSEPAASEVTGTPSPKPSTEVAESASVAAAPAVPTGQASGSAPATLSIDSFENELAAVLAGDLTEKGDSPPTQTPHDAVGGEQPTLVAPPQSAPAQPAAKPAKDPFSIDAIEAEFARLLNRPGSPKR